MMIGIGTPRSHSKIPRPMFSSFQQPASDRREQTRSLWNRSKLCIIFAQLISRVQLTRSTVHLAETTTKAQGGRQGDFASRNSRGNNSTGGVLDRLVTRFPCPPAPSASFCPVRVVLGRGFFGLGQGHDWVKQMIAENQKRD
jgi:hypothetical protein